MAYQYTRKRPERECGKTEEGGTEKGGQDRNALWLSCPAAIDGP